MTGSVPTPPGKAHPFLPLRWQRAIGALLLALWLGMLWQKAQAGVLPELLWLCHVTSLLLGLALLANWRRGMAVGFLLQWAAALPAYLFYLTHGGHSDWCSLLLHILAPLAGALACWRRHLPPATPWLGLAGYWLLWLLCRQVTPQGMNINLAFQPAMLLPQLGPWPNHGLNWLVLGGILLLCQAGWNRLHGAARNADRPLCKPVNY